VTLALAGARFVLLRVRYGSRLRLSQRAHWLQQTCGLVLRRLGVEARCRGHRPGQGLIVSNHLSYLDIPVFAAATPCIFVAKREVRAWPIFGWFARCSGTIFIDRRSRASTDAVAQQMIDVLREGVAVLLFPEGTSTDGSVVLRFHPSLLEPAIALGAEITPAAIAYRMAGGEERDVCYYGDVRFAPHLLEVLGRTGIRAEIEFDPEAETYADRKAAAQRLREKVISLRLRMDRGSTDIGG
jgi:lyso-ornithine lipid O-acyltransferase